MHAASSKVVLGAIFALTVLATTTHSITCNPRFPGYYACLQSGQCSDFCRDPCCPSNDGWVGCGLAGCDTDRCAPTQFACNTSWGAALCVDLCPNLLGRDESCECKDCPYGYRQCEEYICCPNILGKALLKLACARAKAAAFGQAVSCQLGPPSARQVCLRSAASAAGNATSVCKLALDPPDSNFTVIAQPLAPVLLGQPFTVTQGETQQEIDALNALLVNQEQQMGLIDAFLTSVNRTQGAIIASDRTWGDNQNQAAKTYAAQLIPLLLTEPALRTAVQAASLTAGTQVQVTPTDVSNFQAAVQKAGNQLPAELATALTQLGVDSGGQADLVQSFLAADSRAVAALRGFPETLTAPSMDAANGDVATSMASFAGVAAPPTTTSSTLPPNSQLIDGASLEFYNADPQRVRLRFGVVSHDATIEVDPPGNPGDPIINGGSLRIRTSTYDRTFVLPPTGWRFRRSRGYRFRGTRGNLLGESVWSVWLRDGFIYAAGFREILPLDQDPRPVDVVLTAGARKYCAQFGGPTGGRVAFTPYEIFVALHAPPASGCPSDPTTTTTTSTTSTTLAGCLPNGTACSENSACCSQDCYTGTCVSCVHYGDVCTPGQCCFDIPCISGRCVVP